MHHYIMSFLINDTENLVDHFNMKKNLYFPFQENVHILFRFLSFPFLSFFLILEPLLVLFCTSELILQFYYLLLFQLFSFFAILTLQEISMTITTNIFVFISGIMFLFRKALILICPFQNNSFIEIQFTYNTVPI